MTENGKIKVLQFPITNRRGGITQYILQNWRSIDKDRFHFEFATMSKKLDYEESLTDCGSKVHYISCYAEADRDKFIEEFTNILVDGNFDIVHLHTKWWKSFLVEEIAKKAGVKKIIVHAHNTGIDIADEETKRLEVNRHNKIKAIIDESVATDFWACSRLAADFLYGDRIPKEKVKIMNNAIDLTKFAFNEKKRIELRKELGIADDEYVIGQVGRMAYQKNHEFLLRVFRELSNKEKNYKLLLVGDGELKDDCLKFVRENGLTDKVIFLGFRSDVNQLLQAMDVFCLPSRFEGFPISLIEAHASGLKCIASDRITEEVIISDLIKRLPLVEDLWIEEITNKNTVDRYSYQEITKCAGYDIRTQIKVIEAEYLK